MSSRCPALHPLSVALWLALPALAAQAQTPAPAEAQPAVSAGTLSAVTVEASADASAEGLAKPYAGGQVARGGRVGILGTQDVMSTPFSTTAYTQALIQNQQARSVADVLQNDPSVRVARGFGNFQESFFVRGFIVNSDDIAYNGLYGLLPRQYISSELFERVEVLRGASTFLNGATPSGGGIGGNINLLPKRAGNEPLTQVSAGVSSGSQGYVAADLSRRFGADQSSGIRLNAARRNGGTAVDGEKTELNLLSVGVDWRSRHARVSADIGHQEHTLKNTRPNVTLGSAVTVVPRAPDNKSNFAQPWTYSFERDTFGSVRGEYDITPALTAWVAGGLRRSFEDNSLAGPTVSNGLTSAATASRFDNTRKDDVKTGEVGLRGTLQTGPVGHEWVLAYSYYALDKKNAYGLGSGSVMNTNLFAPTPTAFPPRLSFLGNDLANPALNGTTRLKSLAVGDTLSFLGERLRVTLGARHQSIESREISYRTVSNGVQTNAGGRVTSYDKSRTSPVVGVVFKARDDLSVYANYIEGLAQGETAPSVSGGRQVSNAGQQFSPYVSKQKEIGLKYDGGRIGGTLAFFSTAKPRAFLSAAGTFGVQGEDRHQGAELNLFGEATKGLRVLGGLTWLDAEQKSTGSSSTDGKRVIGVARLQGTVGLDWDVPGVPGLSLNGRVVANGASYANAINTLRVPGWTRLDLGARYVTEVAGKLVTVRARIDNVTDRDYWSSVGGYPGSGYLVLGNPRSFNLSASLDF